MSGFVKKVQRRFGIHKDSSRKAKLAHDLLNFQKCVEHGFPHKPSAVAHDPKLKLLALGTKSGAVKVYGAPGVELYGTHENGSAVKNLYFLPDQGRLISIDVDNHLHLWEINVKDNATVLEEVKKCSVGAEEGHQSQVSVCCLTSDAETLLIGTEGGNILQLDVPTFALREKVIYQDVIMQGVADDFKLSPGSVEAIAQHPTEPSKFLIGYYKGLIVFWDNTESKAEHTYNGNQQLESLDWHHDGSQFISAHNDGSYIIWNIKPENETPGETIKPSERATTPYGPFPCKAINKILWKTAKGGPFIILSGGMPRASYGERHTVSVMQGVNQVVFDVTSKIVDFITIDEQGTGDERPDVCNPHTLVIIAEEEMIVIDLSAEGWPTFQLPYLSSMHSSAITCAHHVSGVAEETLNKISEAGKSLTSKHTSRAWPITGGQETGENNATRDLLLTGHEDGTIRFWDASTPDAKLLYKLSTADAFEKEEGAADAANDGDEEWPPFRKVGTFDPYSDDPRLGIQKITFDAVSETLVTAGSAGQVVVLNLASESSTYEVKTFASNIVNDRDNFVWKGHEALNVQGGDVTFPAGFQPTCVMQMMPPAACTAITMHATWQIIAAGTAHGFTLFDYNQKKEITSKCTLNPQDHTGDPNLSRTKKFTQSLRHSIRRLRDRRRNKAEKKSPKGSPKGSPKKSSKEVSEASAAAEVKPAEGEKEPETKEEAAASEEKKEEEKKEEEKKEEATGGEEAAAAAPEPTPVAKKETSPVTTPTEHQKPVERQVEARGVDDSMNSIVKSLYFADTFILDATSHSPSLWAGTNGGIVFVYKIVLPEAEKRDSDAVQCDLCKEIKLRHRAPVISISVLDKSGTPLAHPNATDSKQPDMTGSHCLLICSEEQMKIFSLPSLKAKLKEKITAHDGCRIRRVDLISIRSKNDEEYISYGAAILNNHGEVSLFNVPQLSFQTKHNCIKKGDIHGINSCIFTNFGEGFYLGSPSEFVRFAITAKHSVKPCYTIELKEGMRPVPPEPEPEVKEEEKTDTKVEEGSSEGDKTKEEGDGAEADHSTADDSQVEHTPATDITIDSVKEYMTSSEAQSSSTVTVERSFTSSVTTKSSSEVTEIKSGADGEVHVASTTTTSESHVKESSEQ
ncbi:lethal(2) giant larvae protein homolog 1-like isoform X2 [Lineus longissimus]|uniref:lethal(2) giant larvae protein homolog 1-like isoform X2 n=1 Tax=Lineus longissimus TaxID=88925 RepID=UPI002B4D299E